MCPGKAMRDRYRTKYNFIRQWKKKLGKNKARINCIPCSHELFFNSKVGRLSSSYSRCFQPKVNKCISEDNKIDCGDSWRKLTESDGYCRCDARRGFAPENKDIDTVCFSTYQYCAFTKCPSTQELALNYTCISSCPGGYHRTDDSDACVESASATAKTKPPKTASSTTDRTPSQGTLATSTEKVDTSDGAVSAHSGESQQELEEEDQSLLSHVEQGGTGVPWKRTIPNDRELWNVASLVGKSWRGLGVHLGLSIPEIDQIVYDYRGHIDIVYGMMSAWRKSSSNPTLRDLKNAILQSGVDFHWDSEKLQDIFDEGDQNADVGDTTDDGRRNADVNDTTDERGINTASNDTSDDGDKNSVFIDIETNSNIDVEVDVHTAGSSGVSTGSIASISSIATRSRTDETQV